MQWAGLAKEMDAADIARIQREWVRAARSARDAGFDIVYVYGAHGYLMTQFLSAQANRRTEGYGGSLANRGGSDWRPWRRYATRSAPTARSPPGSRCTATPGAGREGLPGIHIDEMLALVKMADDLVDLWDVTVGSWPEDSGTSRYFPEGHERPWAHQVRRQPPSRSSLSAVTAARS